MQALRVGGANYSPDRRSGRLRDALVAIQLAATVVLLVGTALLVRTLIGLRSTPLGFSSRNITVARLVPQWNGKTGAEKIQAFLSTLLARTKALPGVEAAAISDLPPLGYGFANGEFRLKNSDSTEAATLKAESWAISPGYFETLSIPLLEGRPFDDHDSAKGQPVVIVNQFFVQRWFAGKQPLGERIFVEGKWRRIVGVASNTKTMLFNTIAWRTMPQIYLPEAQAIGFGSNPVVRSVQISIRSARPLARDEFQRLVASVDPDTAVAEFQSLSGLVADSTKQPDLRALLLVGFSAIALLLATIGIFGTISQFVKQRCKEMGIRAALGATPKDLVRSVVLRGLSLAAAGVLLGTLISLAGSRLVASLLYGVKPFDPLAFVTAAILLLFAAAAASLIPARHAAQTDPMTALRDE